MEKITWAREIPVRYSADIAVIGGGIAGVSAACAAADLGVSVILVENFASLGGNMTTGGVTGFCGENKGQGAIFDEISAGMEAFKAASPYAPYGTRYDPNRIPGSKDGRLIDTQLLSVVLQEMVLRRGIELLLHAKFTDVIKEGSKIIGVVIAGASGPELVKATHFIDCTGDGLVAWQAGFEVSKGCPSGGLQLPMSYKLYVHEEKKGYGTAIPDGWFDQIETPEDLPMVSPNKTLFDGYLAVKIKIPLYDSTDTVSLARSEIFSRLRAMQVVEYYQRVEDRHWRILYFSPRIGIREGYRITGLETLSIDDLRAGREFPNAIARGVYYLDGHKPDDDGRTYILSEEERYVPPYQIPFGTLVARNGNNLFMAGRCFSADQLALSSARVSTTCSMTGQAAGIGAALAIRSGSDSHQVDGLDVRRIVEAKGANLLVH